MSGASAAPILFEPRVFYFILCTYNSWGLISGSKLSRTMWAQLRDGAAPMKVHRPKECSVMPVLPSAGGMQRALRWVKNNPRSEILILRRERG